MYDKLVRELERTPYYSYLYSTGTGKRYTECLLGGSMTAYAARLPLSREAGKIYLEVIQSLAGDYKTNAALMLHFVELVHAQLWKAKVPCRLYYPRTAKIISELLATVPYKEYVYWPEHSQVDSRHPCSEGLWRLTCTPSGTYLPLTLCEFSDIVWWLSQSYGPASVVTKLYQRISVQFDHKFALHLLAMLHRETYNGK